MPPLPQIGSCPSRERDNGRADAMRAADHLGPVGVAIGTPNQRDLV